MFSKNNEINLFERIRNHFTCFSRHRFLSLFFPPMKDDNSSPIHYAWRGNGDMLPSNISKKQNSTFAFGIYDMPLAPSKRR